MARWSEADENFLRENWGIISVKEIAEKVNRTPKLVYAKASRMKLPKLKAWLEEETDTLILSWGRSNVSTIAKKIGRTEGAIVAKAERLKLGPACSNEEYYSIYKLAQVMNIDYHVISNSWVKRHGLPITKRRIKERLIYVVKIDNLMLWLENNQDVWDSRRLDIYGLGTEPDWLKEKRKADAERPHKSKTPWTTDQDKIIKGLFKSGFTHREIGEKVGRSKSAVQHRLSRIDVWG